MPLPWRSDPTERLLREAEVLLVELRRAARDVRIAAMHARAAAKGLTETAQKQTGASNA